MIQPSSWVEEEAWVQVAHALARGAHQEKLRARLQHCAGSSLGHLELDGAQAVAP